MFGETRLLIYFSIRRQTVMFHPHPPLPSDKSVGAFMYDITDSISRKRFTT